MSTHFKPLPCQCECGEEATEFKVLTSSKCGILLRWNCKSCGETNNLLYSLKVLKEYAVEMHILDEESIIKTGEFTKEDDSYLREMNIGGEY